MSKMTDRQKNADWALYNAVEAAGLSGVDLDAATCHDLIEEVDAANVEASA